MPITPTPITPTPITPYHCYRSLSTPHRHLYAGTAAVGAADTLPKDAYVKRGAGAASPKVSAGDAHTAALVARVCGPGRLPGDAWGRTSEVTTGGDRLETWQTMTMRETGRAKARAKRW